MDLPNPFRAVDAPRRAEPAGPGVANWARLWVMFLVFIFIIVAMISLKIWMDRHKPAAVVPLPGTEVRQQAPPPPPAAPQPKVRPAETRALADPEAIAVFRELAAHLKETSETMTVPLALETADFLEAARVLTSSIDAPQAARLAKEIPAARLARDPETNRGAFVRFSARLIHLREIPIPIANPAGLTVVYEGYLADPADRHPVVFYALEKPAFDLKTYTWKDMEFAGVGVDIEGVFLRLLEYQGKSVDGAAPTSRVAPVLIVKTMRPVPEPKPDERRQGFAMLVGGIAAVFVVIILVAGYMSRKYGGRAPLRTMLARRPAPPDPPREEILGDEVDRK